MLGTGFEMMVAGVFGVYLDSRGDKSPYRMKMRPMGLSLVGAFDPMLRGQKIADLIATCAAIDVVILSNWSNHCVNIEKSNIIIYQYQELQRQ